MMGILYVIKLKEFNIYKFGISKTDLNLGQRVAAIQTGCPFKLGLQRFFYCENYKTLEGIIHEKLRKHKLNGEWFRLELEDLARITDYIQRKAQGLTDGIVIHHSLPTSTAIKTVQLRPAPKRSRPKTQEQEDYYNELAKGF